MNDEKKNNVKIVLELERVNSEIKLEREKMNDALDDIAAKFSYVCKTKEELSSFQRKVDDMINDIFDWWV